MKLIIDIRDEKYRHITEMPNVYGSEICEVIRNGIPLPKGHGDLISREALKKAIYNDLRLGDEENGSDAEYMAGLQDCYNLIDNIRTDADPTPKVHGDLISREALKRKLQYIYSCDYIDSKSKEGIASDIIDEIDNVPTVDAYPFEQVQELVKLNQQFAQEIENLKRPQDEWIDYDNTFYQCPDCGYLLEKCCPKCQNKVVLPKGSEE